MSQEWPGHLMLDDRRQVQSRFPIETPSGVPDQLELDRGRTVEGQLRLSGVL